MNLVKSQHYTTLDSYFDKVFSLYEPCTTYLMWASFLDIIGGCHYKVIFLDTMQNNCKKMFSSPLNAVNEIYQ